MGVLDKFLSTISLDQEFDDDDYEDDDEVVVSRRRFGRNRDEDEDEEEFRPEKRAKVTPMPRTKKSSLAAGMEVCVIKPTSVEDSKAIVDTLLDNRTVVINLEGITVEAAQRIMDYTSGANAALNGHLQKISRNIFIVTPRSVDISGDFQDVLSGSVDMYDNSRRM
ncbi:MAG: cell division protein SepF [Lachnospiraceae bacterium]|nr:cell division protein SepF [Lachnospiraceae bacterium]